MALLLLFNLPIYNIILHFRPFCVDVYVAYGGLFTDFVDVVVA